MTISNTLRTPLFIRLCFCLLIAIPTSVWAGGIIEQETTLTGVGYLPILLGAFFGGITSTFIRTDVDSNLNHVWFAKLIIGACLGFFACLTWQAYAPNMTTMKLAFPAFALGSLGAPIMVFLLTWAADPKTRLKAGETLNHRLGLLNNETKDE